MVLPVCLARRIGEKLETAINASILVTPAPTFVMLVAIGKLVKVISWFHIFAQSFSDVTVAELSNAGSSHVTSACSKTIASCCIGRIRSAMMGASVQRMGYEIEW